jgi:ATP-dependent Clp protease ATP-binding subunit ClpC
MKLTTTPDELRAMQKEIRELVIQKEEAIAGQDYETAANFRDNEKKLKEKYVSEEMAWRDKLGATVPDVTEEHIAEIISSWTGVPVSRLVEEETTKLLQMEAEIHKRLIGQDEAVKVISQAVRRARAGLKDARRPIGSFSEFMERHSTARLVGSPPGYVGYDEGGQLTEAVRRRPYSVVLFDEIEKAHPEVFNMLLQILEDGRLSDAKGKAVNFANTIVIMTSNLGVASLKSNLSLGFQPAMSADRAIDADHAKMRDSILEELKRAFRPEFLNRVDAVVVFQRLNHAQMRQIVDLMVARVAVHLAAQELQLTVSDEAKDRIVEEGFDKIYGARPLRRVIQKVIEDPLSEELLRLKHSPGDTVVVELVDGEIKMQLVSKSARREKSERKEKAEAAAAAPSE